jgi:hypothetical protein
MMPAVGSEREAQAQVLRVVGRSLLTLVLKPSHPESPGSAGAETKPPCPNTTPNQGPPSSQPPLR